MAITSDKDTLKECLLKKDTKGFEKALENIPDKELREFLGAWKDDSNQPHIGLFSLVILCKDAEWVKILGQIIAKLSAADCVSVLKKVDSNGNNILHCVSKHQLTSTADLLLDKLSKELKFHLMTKQNKDGNMPLHSVVEGKNVDLVREYVEVLKTSKPEDLEVIFEMVNNNGCSPLHLAVSQGTPDVVKQLLSNMTPCQRKEAIKIHRVKEYQELCDDLGQFEYINRRYKENSLHLAIKSKQEKIIQVLLQGLPSEDILSIIMEKNSDGDTAVHLAVKDGSLEMLMLMLKPLEFGDLLQALDEREWLTNENALQLIIRKNGEKMLTFLIGVLCKSTAALTNLEMQSQLKNICIAALRTAIAFSNQMAFESLLKVVKSIKNCLTIERIGDEQENLLQYVVRYGNEKLLELLKGVLDVKGWSDALLFCDRTKNNALQLSIVHAKLKALGCMQDTASSDHATWEKALFQRNYRGNNVLHQAAKFGDSEIFKELLKSLGKKQQLEIISQLNSTQETVLHIAVQHRNPRIVEKLLDILSKHPPKLIQIYTSSNPNTILHQSVSIRHEKISCFLIENLSSIPESKSAKILGTVSKSGNTVFQAAVETGSTRVIEKILAILSPKTCEQLLTHSNKNGKTALHLAVLTKKPGILNLLLKSCSLIERKKLLHQEDREGFNPRTLAVESQMVEVVSAMLYALHNEEVSPEHNALQEAIGSADKKAYIEILKEMSPHLSSDLNAEDPVMHLAIQSGNLQMLKVLLKFPIQKSPGNLPSSIPFVEQENSDGENAIFVATRLKSDEALRLLLDKQEPSLIFSKNRNGNSTCHIAAEKDDVERLSIILSFLDATSKHRVLKLCNTDKQNVLCSAVASGGLECLKYIIQTVPSAQDLEDLIVDPRGTSALKLAKNLHHNEAWRELRKHVSDQKVQYSELVPKIRSGNEQEVADFLNTLNVSEMTNVLSEEDENKSNVLHVAAQVGNAEMMSLLIKKLPAKQQVEFLQKADAKGFTPFQLAVEQQNKSVVKAMLELAARHSSNVLLKSFFNSLPSSNQKKILMTTPESRSFLFYLLALKKVNAIGMLIKMLPEKERVDVIFQTDLKRYSLLHQAVKQENPDALDKLIELVKPGDWEQFITEQSNYRENLIVMAVKLPQTGMISKILKPLPQNQRVKAVLSTSSREVDVMECIIENTRMLESLLMEAAESKKGQITDLFVPCEYKHQAIEQAFYMSVKYQCAEMMKALLDLMDLDQRREVIADRQNKKGNSIFHILSSSKNLEMIRMLLESLSQLPPRQKLGVICSANKYGYNSVSLAVDKDIGALLELLKKSAPLPEKIENEIERLVVKEERNSTSEELLSFLDDRQKTSLLIQQLRFRAVETKKDSFLKVTGWCSSFAEDCSALQSFSIPHRNLMHIALKVNPMKSDEADNQVKRFEVVLEQLNTSEVEHMLTQKDGDGFYALELSVMHLNHRVLSQIFAKISPKCVVQVLTQRNIRQVSILEIAKELHGDVKTVFQDIPTEKQWEVQVLLLQKAIELENSPLLKMMCTNFEETVVGQLPVLKENFSMSQSQISLLNTVSDTYIIPTPQLRAKCYTVFVYEPKFEIQAKGICELLKDIGFQTIICQWETSDRGRIFDEIAKDVAKACSVLMVLVLGDAHSGSSTMVYETIKAMARCAERIPMIFLFESTELDAEKRVASERPHTVVLGAKANQARTGTSFLRKVVEEFRNSLVDVEIIKLCESVARQLEEPIEQRSWLLKEIKLPVINSAKESDLSITEFGAESSSSDYDSDSEDDLISEKLLRALAKLCQVHKVKHYTFSIDPENPNHIYIFATNATNISQSALDGIRKQFEGVTIDVQNSNELTNLLMNRNSLTMQKWKWEGNQWEKFPFCASSDLLVKATEVEKLDCKEIVYSVGAAHMVLGYDQRQAYECHDQETSAREWLEKDTTSQRYEICFNNTLRRDLNHPPLFSYRVYCELNKECLLCKEFMGQTRNKTSPICHRHMIYSDILLLPLEARHNAELYYYLRTLDLPSGSIYPISTRGQIKKLSSEKRPVRIGDQEGALQHPDAALLEPGFMGLHLIFSLTPPGKLIHGDSGRILFIMDDNGKYRPGGLLVSLREMVNSKKVCYRAVLLDLALKGLKDAYCHNIGEISLFEGPAN